MILKDRAFSREEFAARIGEHIGNHALGRSSEDIVSTNGIVADRQSERQYENAVNVAKVQWNTLDVAYLQRWAADLKVMDLWKKALAAAEQQQHRLRHTITLRIVDQAICSPKLHAPTARLHGQPRHDAGRSARRRGDAALLHRELRQRRQHEPRRSARKPATRSTAARESIAAANRRRAKEIVFTSGATESNNLAIRGVAERERRRGNHMVSVATEHKAVLDPLARLSRRGYEVTLLPVETARQPARRLARSAEGGRRAMRDDTILVSVMLANNEIGVIQPMAEIAADLPRARRARCTATPRKRSAKSPSTSSNSAST